MSLQLPQPPAAALRAVLTALDSPSATRSAALTQATRPLVPAHPLPVHLLAPDTPGGTPLTAAPRTGWRFLIRSGEEVVAAADTLETPDGHSFGHFTEGPYLVSTLRALQQARLHCSAARATYQPRLLAVPGHYMTALWLRPTLGPANSPDLLVPLAPAPLGVTAHRVHVADELLPALARARGGGALLASGTQG